MADLQNIRSLIDASRLDEALAALSSLPESESSTAEAWFLRGLTLWRRGNRAAAASAYAHAASLDPEGPAVQALDMARDIEAFFNPDLLNP